MDGTSRWYNIGGPCNPALHDMLPAAARLPEVVSLIRKQKLAYYEKSHEKAYQQMGRYMDRLGVSEGWLVVADSDLAKPWDEKISSTDIPQDGKTIHLVRC